MKPLAGAMAPSRLKMVPLHAADEALFCRAFADAQVMRYIGAPLTAAQARGAFHAMLGETRATPPRRWMWSAWDDTGAALGILALTAASTVELRQGRLEIGVVLLPEAQGQGIGLQAAAALMRHGRRMLSARAFWTRHHPQHSQVAHVMMRLGFSRVSQGERETRWEWRVPDTGRHRLPHRETACPV